MCRHPVFKRSGHLETPPDKVVQVAGCLNRWTEIREHVTAKRAQERQGERAWFLCQKPLLCNRLAYAAPVKAKKQQPWVVCLEPSTQISNH